MKRITIYEFMSLPDQEQFNILFNYSNFFAAKPEGDSVFALYAVDMFFVEVEYDRKSNAILNKKAFKTGELLDKYSNLNLLKKK